MELHYIQITFQTNLVMPEPTLFLNEKLGPIGSFSIRRQIRIPGSCGSFSILQKKPTPRRTF